MKTKLFAVLTAIALLICVAVPALAAPVEVNMWEYADVQVDGLTKLVTIRFPTDWLRVGVLDSGYAVKYSQTGNVSGFDLTDTDFLNGHLKVSFSPLGVVKNPYSGAFTDGRLLDLHDLPVGSVLHYALSVEMQAASGQSFAVSNSVFNYGYYDGAKLTKLKLEPVPYNLSGNIFTTSYDFVIADNSQPLFFQHYFEFSTNSPSSRWIFRLDDFVITTSIDALKELVEATGETNRLLDEVNKKLDAITDYQPDPTTPGGGIGEDLEDAEDQLMDGAQQGLQDFTTHTQGFLAWLTGSATAFVAAGALLGVILDVQMYNDLLYASLILGSFALFLGAAITIFKRRE